MFVVENAGDGSAAPLLAAWQSHAARFGLHWPAPDIAVVSADGELDAANAGHLGDYVVRVATQSRHLVLDLTGVEFFGTEGFSMLNTLNVRCAEAGACWAMVPSAAVNRVLRICDPQGGLSVVGTVDAALERARGGRRRLLQLVTE